MQSSMHVCSAHGSMQAANSGTSGALAYGTRSPQQPTLRHATQVVSSVLASQTHSSPHEPIWQSPTAAYAAPAMGEAAAQASTQAESSHGVTHASKTVTSAAPA